MKRFIFVISLVLLVFFIVAQEKENQNPKEIFLEAESYLLYEEYGEALPLYLKLSKADPENDNLNFKVGLCYLSVPYEKDRAIIYLEKAVKNINPNYKPNNFKERQAPLDALFYLGNAYRINNQLEKALETYYQFKKEIDPEIYDEVIVDEQIATIGRAKRYLSKPIKFEPKNVGEPINSKFAETNAVVSADEKTLIYNVKLQFYDALFFSVKNENNQWSGPINIIPELGVDGDVYATSLSANGKELYLYRSDNFDGNLYVSRYTNNRWSPIKKLNENINTKFWESHACISADGKTLYFTSNRKGGYGGLDIFQSKRDDLNSDLWQRAQNMGPQINTTYNEETPFITEDGTTLFFSSYGHFNMGGYDIFYSNLLENGKWSAPLNMGFPINSTDDDVFFVPVKGGKYAYISRYFEETFGKTDIYRFEIYSEQHPRKFILKGLLSLPPGIENANPQLVAYIVNKLNRDTVQIIPINPKEAKFDSKLFAGNYQLIIAGNGLEKSIQDFSIDKNQAADELTLKANMKNLDLASPDQEIAQEPILSELVFSKNFYSVENDKQINIPLDLPIGSKVKLEISIDSVLTKSDVFEIKKQNFIYSYKPVKGKNLLKFTVTTPDKNIKEGIVFIIYNEQADTMPGLHLTQRQAEMQFARIMLMNMASPELSKRIQQTASEDLQISLAEYGLLLKSFASIDTFSTNEVDSLIGLFNENQALAAKLFIRAIKEVASPQLNSGISHACEGKEFSNIFELVNTLITNDEIRRNKLELVSASSKLADKGSVYYYLDALSRVAPGNMKASLVDIHLNEKGIQSPDELLNYLYSIQSKSGFTENDIYSAYFSIPIFTSPAGLLEIMAGLSNEPMFNFLNTVQVNEKQITNGYELGMQLKKLAPEYKISQKSILSLLIKANTSHYFNNYKDEVRLFATGEVKDILNRFTLEEAKADSTSELLNWLLKHSDSEEFKNDLILTFSQIAAKNLLESAKIVEAKDNNTLSILNISVISVFSILLIFIILINVLKKKRN